MLAIPHPYPPLLLCSPTNDSPDSFPFSFSFSFHPLSFIHIHSCLSLFFCHNIHIVSLLPHTYAPTPQLIIFPTSLPSLLVSHNHAIITCSPYGIHFCSCPSILQSLILPPYYQDTMNVNIPK